MSEDAPFVVRKISQTMPVSCCVMSMSTGVNYCEHPLPAPPTQWERTRWRLTDWWSRNKPHVHRGPCEVDE